ncbi:cupin domain-containing protein [Oceanobacillus sp. CFH 90083]|uniref:cupin domain-containing protein n=1 Tax=Oceanobacillus sp. CFH 90083 TaxID=2592336 RepID=UPI001D152126|nr:cupin domain-containing protein [Oceanobacillus sp. CFH 90083]
MYYNPFYQQQMNRMNPHLNQGSAYDKQTAIMVEETLQREAALIPMYFQVLEPFRQEDSGQEILYAVQSKNQIAASLEQIYQHFTGRQIDTRQSEHKQEEHVSFESIYEYALQSYEEHYRKSEQVNEPYSRQLLYQLAMTDYQIANHLAEYLETSQDSQMYSRVTDYGGNPFVIDIENAAEANTNYRTALWTGEHLQVTLMSIPAGSDIGLEVHPDTDQFLRIEEGEGTVQMGNRQDNLTIQQQVEEDSAIMVPAGTWHNITNTGDEALKLYTIYAPPHHPFGTVERTKEEAMQKEG